MKVVSTAVAPPPDESGSIDVDRCAIAWQAWGDRDHPATVLVHGARAHQGWWNWTLTPELRAGRRIVTLDLGGHGDSGHRETYSPRLWGEDVAAAARAGGSGRISLVGHSMGGWASIVCASLHPDLVAGVVLVDSSVRRPQPGAESAPRGMAERPLRLFASREEAVASFRLLPEQPPVAEAVIRPVAERSLRREGEMWRWKFDPAIAQRYSDGLIRDHLAAVRCPLHLVHGSRDPIVSAGTAAEIAEMAGFPVAATVIPGAHHHAILDHPEEVAVAVLACGVLPPAAGDRSSD